jgi:hypothetical protein
MPLDLTQDLMIVERIVCCLCIYSKKYNKKKENLKKSGYLVEKPFAFYLEEDGKYSVSTFI